MRRFFILCIIIAIFTVSVPLVAVSDNSEPLVNFKNEETSKTSEKTEASDDNTVKVLATESNSVITVDEKEYIIGCVAAEMPASYHEEALKAQAVACYTYMKLKKSQGADSSLNGADISDSSKTNQGFLTDDQMKAKWGDSFDKYYGKISAAVESVLGKTITYNNEPVMAVFHAICPSKTESAETVWGKDIPYLQSVASTGDKLSPSYSSTLVVTQDEFKNLASVIQGASFGDNPEEYIVNPVLSDCGTVKSVTVGGVSVSGETVRAAFSLKSAAFTVKYENGSFTFSVSGYGHFVGMSQYGADYMARQGSTYDQILKHYYTGVEIV